MKKEITTCKKKSAGNVDYGNSFSWSQLKRSEKDKMDTDNFLAWGYEVEETLTGAAQSGGNFVRKAGTMDMLQSEILEENRVRAPEFSLESSIKEIEKMDAFLRIKVSEEKKAKLSRIRAEEECRYILSSLGRSWLSNGIKANLEEFTRLLTEKERTDSGHDTEASENEIDDWGKNKEKKNYLQRMTLEPKFIERNILLAKCGRGTLSLTVEEKRRIRGLLQDLEEGSLKNDQYSKEMTDSAEEMYAFDRNSKLLLSQIDEKLQVFKRKKIFEESDGKSMSPEKINEENPSCENEHLRAVKAIKKMPNSLREIDKLLDVMNCASAEEINPMSEEDLEILLRESEQSLNQTEAPGKERATGKDTGEEDEILNLRPSREVIAGLVSNAKSLMPKFRYRFDD